MALDLLRPDGFASRFRCLGLGRSRAAQDAALAEGARICPLRGSSLRPRCMGLPLCGRLAPNPNPMNKTIRSKAEEWAARFSQIPLSVIRKMAQADEAMYEYDSDSLRLAASPYLECDWCCAIYKGKATLKQLYALADEGRGELCRCAENDGYGWVLGRPQRAFPCKWRPLFAPHRRDGSWMLENSERVAALGFFVFESEDWGCLLGVDAITFDFIEPDWLGLYQLRPMVRRLN